ncbi:hypothetical protein B9Z55_023696 [Caenorhabditis nigoni]|uniref:Uncharacterized protein n=1 Tax=Caenorhabditis nigoni TaxID=1611254 RepID=A0A2G5SRB1_9PELO|nr:hypothetical protein B9Z55_023696 [Caenorhabditis nigoni]
MTSHIPFFMFEDMLKWMADNEVASIGHTPATCKFTRLLVKKILGKMETSSFGARWRSQVLEEARQSSGINSARLPILSQCNYEYFCKNESYCNYELFKVYMNKIVGR